MKILKKENWWIWLLLFLFSNGTSPIVLGSLLEVYDKDAWYAKLKNWIIGLVFIIPFPIMLSVFYIEILCKTSVKLDIKGYDYYLSPYVWISFIIIPIIGWISFIALFLYLNIAILVNLYKGKGEKYIS